MTERRKTSWTDRMLENQRSMLAFGVLVICLLAIILLLFIYF